MGWTVQKRLVETDITRPTFIASIVVLDVAGVTVLIERARPVLEVDAATPEAVLAPAVGGAGTAWIRTAVGRTGGFDQVSRTIMINRAFQASAVVTERVMSWLTVTVCLTFRARG